MNISPSHSATIVVHPRTDRLAAAIDRTLAAMRAAIDDLRRRRQARSAGRRALDGIAHLNEHVLKDIGAPHWLVADAAERREARHLQWIAADFR